MSRHLIPSARNLRLILPFLKPPDRLASNRIQGCPCAPTQFRGGLREVEPLPPPRVRRSFPTDPFTARHFPDRTRECNRRLRQAKARSGTVRNPRQYPEKLIEPHIVMTEQIPFSGSAPFRHRQDTFGQIF